MSTESAGGEKREPRKLRVLVVEDNRDSADSLALLLTSWGHEARVVYDGLRVLDTAREFQPDVALLDLGLPGMDGYQIALHLRREPVLQGLTLIAVTGHDWKNAHLRSKEYGFDDHWIKPIDLDRLRTQLSTLKPRQSGAP